jgi:hypothetical protein
MGHAKPNTASRRAPQRAPNPAQLEAWATPRPPELERQYLEKSLVAIAQELARKAGAQGVTMCDVRIYAEQRGLLTGQEHDRSLSWLHGIPRMAGLVTSGRVRPSTLPRAHGNYQRVWILPAFAEGAV